MPRDMPMEKDVAKLVTRIVECFICLTVFQGRVVVNSGHNVKTTEPSPALCWKASKRGR